jgi:hypothetical protein
MAEMNQSSSQRGIMFIDLLKLFGGLAVFIPLIAGYFQYRQSVQQDLDKNFRSVIEKLSSENREERLAASSSIGTFITKEGKYYDEATDILINRLSIELDYNVLNAIRASLEKIEKEEYRKVIDKLLDIERNIFIQEYALKKWKDEAKVAFEESEQRYLNRESLFKQYESTVDKDMLDNFKEDMNLKWETYSNREKDFKELTMHKQVVSDFLSIFLKLTRTYPIEEVEFFRNSMNFVTMIGLNLINSKLTRSAFSSSNLLNSDLEGSTIIHTFFSFSDLTNSRFANCNIKASLFNDAILRNVDFSGSEFKDVFFAGSELTGTNFSGAKNLRPLYFYKAQNVDKALFDLEFKKELDEKLKNISEDEFKDYVENSELTELSVDEIFKTLDKLRTTDIQVEESLGVF